eukprot:SAG31_NODE_29968_length_387_cov_0.722222_1_plen_36_part_01
MACQPSNLSLSSVGTPTCLVAGVVAGVVVDTKPLRI